MVSGAKALVIYYEAMTGFQYIIKTHYTIDVYGFMACFARFLSFMPLFFFACKG